MGGEDIYIIPTMELKILTLILVLFASTYCECDQHDRRVRSEISDLKQFVFKGYDKTVKPDDQVKVNVGFQILDLRLCPHKQV